MPDIEDAPAPQPPQQVVHVPTNIPFPAKLDLKGNVATNWKRFKRVWDNYEIATGLTERDTKLRAATFLTCVGPDALEIYDGMSFDNDQDKTDVVKIIQKFDDFCVGETNEIYERYCFNKREQEPNENIEAYVTALRALAKTCNYGDLENALIRDRLVIGIRDNSTRRKLLQHAKLTLKDCIDICRANEQTTQQLKCMNQEEVQTVQKKFTKSAKKPWTAGAKGKQTASSNSQECGRCGRTHGQKKELCPAFRQVCNKCGIKNHFAKQCKNESRPGAGIPKYPRRKANLRAVTETTTSSDEEYVLSLESTVYTCNSEENFPRRLHAMMECEGQAIEFQLDCGSTVNVLPEKVYNKVYQDHRLEKLNSTNVTLVMYNKTETKPLGKRRVRIRNPKNRKKYNVEFVVVGGDVQPILGARAVQAMQLIQVNSDKIMKKDDVKNSITGVGQVGLKYSDRQSTEISSDTLMSEYADVFTGEGKLEGQLHLEVDPSVPPVKLPTRKVPVAMREKLKAELDRLNDLKIITPVDTPTDWISAMVVVMKPSGKVRLCIDPKPLNKALKRNHYPTPTIEDILPELSKARVFTVADTRNGFWHIDLDTESSYLTTFGTPWGRYRWKRLAFGLSPSPEEFQRRLDEALEGLDGVKTIHDDILIFGVGDSDAEANVDHDRKLRALFQRCREKNIRLNKDKLKLRLKEVSYMGHVISADGLRIDPEKVRAVMEMPTPKDKQGVQRLLGMVNYLQKFTPRLSEVTAPLRDLLKDQTEFLWDEQVHGKAVLEIKKILSDSPVLKYFDPEKETTLQCDASQTGLGACILQDGHPIAYTSRALTTTETNYAQIEKELLAVLFGMERFENYTYGRKVKVESDHKPLEVICKKSLLSAPKRLQRMLLRLQKFDYVVHYKKGIEMYVADTLSRAYLPCVVKDCRNEDILEVDLRSLAERETESINMLQYVAISEERLTQIQQATERDVELNTLKSVIRNGWPEQRDSVPHGAVPYFPFRDELSVQNGLVLKGERVVIPYDIRGDILERLHSSHIGIQSCMRRARECVYWPNMNHDIEQFIGKCETCNQYQSTQQKEPMISHEVPLRPWEKVACDLFEFNGKDYLVTVDYYSDFFEVDRLHDKTAPEVVTKLKAIVARHGIPDTMVSDNGPQFTSREFQSFMQKYEIEHVTSSPRYAQSNGKAENAVKTAKRLMRKSLEDETDPYLALLDWRNTPSEGLNCSPAQRLFGRRTKTRLPMTHKLLQPKTIEGVDASLKQRKEKETKYYNRGSKELGKLKDGELVRFKPVGYGEKSWVKARVEGQVDIRSYQVRTEDGRQYRRNRRHLRASKESSVVDRDVERLHAPSVRKSTPGNQPDLVSDESSPQKRPNVLKHSTPRKAKIVCERSEESVSPAAVETRMSSSGRVIRAPVRFKDYETV